MPETIFDASAYPLVELFSGRIHDMAAYRIAENGFLDLFARRGRFVLISHGDHPEDEPAEVTSARARFFRQHRDSFRSHCASIIGVEPDPAQRVISTAKSEGASRGIGIPIQVVASSEEARALAAALLAAP